MKKLLLFVVILTGIGHIYGMQETHYPSTDIQDLVDDMGDLALTENTIRGHNVSEQELETLQIEVGNVRSLLQELLEKQTKPKAQILLAGIKLFDITVKGKPFAINVDEIVTDNGSTGLITVISASDYIRRIVRALILCAQKPEHVLHEKAQYIIRGFKFFAKQLFGQELPIEKIVRNNVVFIQVFALLVYKQTTQQDKDHRYAKNLKKAYKRACNILGRELSVVKYREQSYTQSRVSEALLTAAYVGGCACFYLSQFLPNVGTAAGFSIG